ALVFVEYRAADEGLRSDLPEELETVPREVALDILDVVDEEGPALAVAEDEDAPRLWLVQMEAGALYLVDEGLVVAEAGAEFQVAPVLAHEKDETPIVVEPLAQDVDNLEEHRADLIVLADDVADLVDHEGVVVVAVALLEEFLRSGAKVLDGRVELSLLEVFADEGHGQYRERGQAREMEKQGAPEDEAVGRQGRRRGEREGVSDPLPHRRLGLPPG